MSKNMQALVEIKSLRERYLRVSRGKESLLQMIEEVELAEQVYNSNAIENSTLSLEETEKILLKIDLDRFINDRELFEAKNLARVVEYINKKASEKELSTAILLFLHKILISNIRDDIAGRFRGDNEWVKVANHIAPNPSLVSSLIEEMLTDYQVQKDESIVKRVARLHLTFEYIHPFVDGNGRMGRVINNYVLMREGYVPINIKFMDRSLYYKAFQDFDRAGETKIMEQIVAKALTSSYHKRLAYLEGKNIITLTDFAKKMGISHSNCINKAHRQTIEAFWEKGVWKIGI